MLAFFAALLVSVIVIQPAWAQTETVLYSFNGEFANSGLIRDRNGNLYGTTYTGGGNSGTIFELAPDGTETVLDYFYGSSPNGVVRDRNGNLYSTTEYGGDFGWGDVFELTPDGVETVLYSFAGQPDGQQPLGDLIRDSEGNLYGTTEYGGPGGGGTVFKLSPAGALSVIYSFSGGTDGGRVVYGVIRDAKGNFYGTTAQGGAYGHGTIFKVSPEGKETVLHSFTGGPDGAGRSAVIRDAKGNLYGIAEGGAYGYGTMFKLTGHKLEVLHSFTGGLDGALPNGVIRDAKGNLYGSTWFGGASGFGYSGYGTVFELTKKGKFTVLYSFTGGTDTGNPAGLLRAQGKLYGSAQGGGAYGFGTIFELVP